MSKRILLFTCTAICGIGTAMAAECDIVLSKPKAPNLVFYGKPLVGVIASQLDGDQASGYNKFGYQLGMITGVRWNDDGFNALEMQMSINERGSRRAFDPITFVNAFHIRCRQVELQVNGVYDADLPVLDAVSFITGLRYAKLLKVEETEGVNPGISEDFAKGNVMIELGLTKSISNAMDLRFTWDYSLSSAVKQDRRNVLYPTGVYHNGVGVSALFKLGSQ
jgi:hypothetical protein